MSENINTYAEMCKLNEEFDEIKRFKEWTLNLAKETYGKDGSEKIFNRAYNEKLLDDNLKSVTEFYNRQMDNNREKALQLLKDKESTVSKILEYRQNLREHDFLPNEEIDLLCAVEVNRAEELFEVARQCEEEGYPSHGENYELRSENINKYYDEIVTNIYAPYTEDIEEENEYDEDGFEFD